MRIESTSSPRNLNKSEYYCLPAVDVDADESKGFETPFAMKSIPPFSTTKTNKKGQVDFEDPVGSYRSSHFGSGLQGNRDCSSQRKGSTDGIQ